MCLIFLSWAGAELASSYKPRHRGGRAKLQSQGQQSPGQEGPSPDGELPSANSGGGGCSGRGSSLGSIWLTDPDRYEEMLRRMYADGSRESSLSDGEECAREEPGGCGSAVDSVAQLEDAYLQVSVAIQ